MFHNCTFIICIFVVFRMERYSWGHHFSYPECNLAAFAHRATSAVQPLSFLGSP